MAWQVRAPYGALELPRCDLSEDDNGIYAKAEEGVLTGPQPHTKALQATKDAASRSSRSPPWKGAPAGSCLSYGYCCYEETPWPKSMLGRKRFFWLIFMHHQRKS